MVRDPEAKPIAMFSPVNRVLHPARFIRALAPPLPSWVKVPARAMVQAHGEGTTARDVWLNPPPIPLTTAEMDHIFDLPYARSPVSYTHLTLPTTYHV